MNSFRQNCNKKYGQKAEDEIIAFGQISMEDIDNMEIATGEAFVAKEVDVRWCVRRDVQHRWSVRWNENNGVGHCHRRSDSLLLAARV